MRFFHHRTTATTTLPGLLRAVLVVLVVLGAAIIPRCCSGFLVRPVVVVPSPATTTTIRAVAAATDVAGVERVSAATRDDDDLLTIRSSTNVLPDCRTSPDLWQSLVPTSSPWNTNSRGFDRTVEWECSTNGSSDNDGEEQEAARQMLDGVVSGGNAQLRQQRQSLLSSWMKRFGEIAKAKRCKARIAAGRGTAGTKCPQWHVDHVPVRWIQSLVGPGCEYVSNPDAVDWKRVNNLDDDDETMSVRQRNSLLVPQSSSDEEGSIVRVVPEGQAAMLLGNAWSEWAAEKHLVDGGSTVLSLPPAVHKSPELNNPWQGRVLLTMDVLE